MKDPATLYQHIESMLPAALHADRMAVLRRLAAVRRANRARSDASRSAVLEGLAKRLELSVHIRQKKAQNPPLLRFNPDLPITAKKDEIIDLIGQQPVVIVAGETGSGKTTQLPKFCLAAGRGIEGRIGCTQPRRIATTSVCHRIAEELGETPGRSVGYKIRFQDRIAKEARIKIMTDGILLAEAQSDPYLNEYDTLIVDEAHERSLNIDFVLGLLKSLVKKRNDLKLIITSATIDTAKFSAAFDDAPIVEVSGRMYPVQTEYLPQDAAQSNGEELTHVDLAVAALDRLQKKTPLGDVLVFMPTEQDIRETCEIIEGRKYPGVTLLPLFARLSAAEQQRVFAPTAGRKIIVATNVAETSLTIPGIQYVIDTGLARVSHYNPTSRTTALPVEPISRSSADQRQGRCGRVAGGVCFRLYSQDDYQSRPQFTVPEILRSNLAEVILRMLALRLGEVTAFPFIDPPAAKSIQDGLKLLGELGAIEPPGPGQKRWGGASGHSRLRLTEKGRLMARLPLDPRLSRMLIEAKSEGCLGEMAVIAAALSIQDPKERPLEKQAEADEAHRRFADPRSDFIALLNIWDQYHAVRAKEKTWGKVKQFCRSHYLSFRRMREWCDIHAQILAILEDQGFVIPPRGLPVAGGRPGDLDQDPAYGPIHRSILSGYLSNIAQRKEKQFFKAAKDREAMLFPGSGLFKNPANWIVAAEMVETTRLYARTVAAIDADWLEALGKPQCRYTYSDPHWERRKGAVVAKEQVTLFGLIIVAGRPVVYGRIDPQRASDIFIRSALVGQDLAKPLGFMQHNRRLIESAQELEDRIRRRDILIEEEGIYRFYEERLSGITDLASLEKCIRRAGGDDFLKMTPEDLLTYIPDPEQLERYPQKISLGHGTQLACSYRFAPGQADDGITVRVPLGAAADIRPQSLDWLVPGLLSEKISALLKALPKAYRRQLVPLTRTAGVIEREMPRQPMALRTALSRFVKVRFGVDVPASAWCDEKSLPDHLRMRIAVIDPTGKILRLGRDPDILQVPPEACPAPDEFAAASRAWEKEGLERWDFGDLPQSVALEGAQGRRWTAYPALVPDGESVRLKLFQDRGAARRVHPQGVATLIRLHLSKDLKFLKRNLILPLDLKDAAADFGGRREVEKQLVESVVGKLFYRQIQTQSEFEACLQELADRKIHTCGQQRLNAATALLYAYRDTRHVLADLAAGHRFNPALGEYLQQLKIELQRLVPAQFVLLYGPERLEQIIRYLKALAIRAQRGVVHLEKDRQRASEIQPFSQELADLLAGLTPACSAEKRRAVEEFYWMLEEFKVSLFAQEIGTAQPVSKKRLDAKLREIQDTE